MKYFIDYQYLPTGASRPVDNGEVVPIEVSAVGAPSLLPEVGDFVHIDNSMHGEDRASFSGRVRSRLFRYICSKHETNCAVNIVVEQTDEDWGKLVKE